MSVDYSIATRSFKAAISTANRAGDFINKFSSTKPKLDEQALIAAAIAKTKGLKDFGEGQALKALHQLVDSLNNESELTAVGRLMVKQWFVNTLKSRLQFEEYWKTHLELSDVKIKKPLFIVDLPRTGTTILLNLLAQDAHHRSPLAWECMSPYPRPGENKKLDASRIKMSDRMLNGFFVMVPEILSIHEVQAEWPQECTLITEFEFLSISYPAMYNVPSYQAWLNQQNFVPGYEFHKRFLQYLPQAEDQRWLLKSPGHLAVLDSLLEVYPDARIIQTHRNPAECIPSLASFGRYLRNIYSNAEQCCDPQAIGQQTKETWIHHLNRSVEVRDNNPDKADQFYDLHYAEFVKDPIKEIEKIYHYFDLPFSDQTAHRMQSFLSSNTQGKHGKHSYTLEEFGYSKDSLQKDFGFYCSRFNVN